MRHSMVWLLLSATVAFGALTLCKPAQAETPVKIGIVQATSGGSAALYGVMQKNAAELAIEEVNASGALGDLKLVGIHQDDGGDRGQSVNIFQRLIVHLFEQVHINVVGLEGVGILGEADSLQPIPDRAHTASCSNNAFASCRTGVSNPSVNQL